MERAFTIQDICQFTSLSDRTIRNYIQAGTLVGEKTNGVWYFTAEQVDRFIQDPNVWPSVQAKKNAIVYDFIRERRKQTAQICVVLDLPGKDGQEVVSGFCRQINEGAFHGTFRFSSEDQTGSPRMILRGEFGDVLRLLNDYADQQTDM